MFSQEKINSTRSVLLRDVNRELQIKRENKNETMINSKKLIEFEKEYEIKMVVSLKSQFFIASPGKLISGIGLNQAEKNQIITLSHTNKLKRQTQSTLLSFANRNFSISFKSPPDLVNDEFIGIMHRKILSAKKLHLSQLEINKYSKENNVKIFDEPLAHKGFSYLNKLRIKLKSSNNTVSELSTPVTTYNVECCSSNMSESEDCTLRSSIEIIKVKEISKFINNSGSLKELKHLKEFKDLKELKKNDYCYLNDDILSDSSMDCMMPFIIEEPVENNDGGSTRRQDTKEEINFSYFVKRNMCRNIIEN